jgi:hypothetical protein
VRILAEVDCRHLRHLVNLAAVGSDFEVWERREHLLQLGDDLLLTAHRLDQRRHGVRRVETMTEGLEVAAV